MERLKSFVQGRPWILVLIVFLVSTTISFTYFWNQSKTVILLVDDEIRRIKTGAKTVGKLLENEKIVLHEQDLLWPSEGTKLTENLYILVKKAKSVHVKIGPGPERTVTTTAQTVEDLLNEMGFARNQNYLVQLDKHEQITENQHIELIHVTYKVIEHNVPLKYKTVRTADNTMPKGREKVVKAGKPGELTVTYKATYHNGKLVQYEPMKSQFTEDPEDQVVAYGVLEPVTVGGYTFLPKKVLENVRLTAYGPGEEHTGKTKDHPGYGITRSGVRAQEGRTVAVDPDLIPLGWWVYIEGYGLYHAEDTGSAVKGKKIDIYYEDDDEATKFGLKKGYKVYVIGPEKPK